ncbi:MAG: hypothetical protein P8Y25_03785 [Chromatiaceae bacterium]|jgi:hypothetical protein
MSRFVPPACACCHPHDRERNEQTDELPTCDAFASVPDFFHGTRPLRLHDYPELSRR